MSITKLTIAISVIAAFVSLAIIVQILRQRLQARRWINVPEEYALAALQKTIDDAVETYGDNPEKLNEFLREQVKKLRVIHAEKADKTPNLGGHEILWVDDNPTNNTYEMNILRNFGIEISIALSTKGALQLLGKHHFDLIISDRTRFENGIENHKAGYQLIEEINKRHLNQKIIIYTGSLSRLDTDKLSLAYSTATMPGELIDQVVRAIQTESTKPPQPNAI